MAYTLLNAVNATLKRVKIISGVSGELTLLTDTARQQYIDTALQVWNEILHEIYSRTEEPYPLDSAESTITLMTGTREYNLPSDLEFIRYPLVN